MWGRFALAGVLAFLFLGIVLPNTGRMVVDSTTTPPTPHVVDRAAGSLIAIVLAAVPLALVCIGTVRRSSIAIPGWIGLSVLVVMAMTL